MSIFKNIVDRRLYIGKEILQFCFGQNEIIINMFPEGNSITSLNPLHFKYENREIFDNIIENTDFCGVVGFSIDLAEYEGGRLTFSTSGGGKIVLSTDGSGYDSIVFSHENEVLSA